MHTELGHVTHEGGEECIQNWGMFHA